MKSQEFPLTPDGNTLGIMMSQILFRATPLLWQLVAHRKTSINLAIYKTCDSSGNLTWISLFSSKMRANMMISRSRNKNEVCSGSVTYLMLFDTNNVRTPLLIAGNRLEQGTEPENAQGASFARLSSPSSPSPRADSL
jgi:hypothetical protein